MTNKEAILIMGDGRRERMLRDEIAKYMELTGEDGAHVPIIKLGAFLEGIKTSFNMVRLEEVKRVIDKYKAESEDKE